MSDRGRKANRLFAEFAQLAVIATSVSATGYLSVRPKQRVVAAFLTNLSLWTEKRHALARRLADLAARSNDGT